MGPYAMRNAFLRFHGDTLDWNMVGANGAP